MKTVSMDICIEQPDLDLLMERYPLFEHGVAHWERNRVYFKDRTLSDKNLEFHYRFHDDTIEVKTPSGYVKFFLKRNSTGGVLHITTVRQNKNFYFNMFGLGIMIENVYFPNETEKFLRLWTLENIINDESNQPNMDD